MKTKLCQVAALCGHTDDAAYTGVTLLYPGIQHWTEVLDGDCRPVPVGFIVNGGVVAIGGVVIAVEDDGIYQITPDDIRPEEVTSSGEIPDGADVVRGGCGFCGGDLVIPHGHSYGACWNCGAI